MGKQREKVASQRAAHYRSFFTHAREGFFRSTPEGYFTEVNPALVRLLGYKSVKEVLALTLPDDLYVDPTQRESLQATYETAGVVAGAELHWKKKNGEQIMVSLYARARRGAPGRIVGYEGVVVDITARKQAEEALTASEATYRAIFAASPDFLYLTDSKGKLLDANPALLEWQELSLEELQQRHFLDFLAGDNQAEVVQAFTALQQGRTPDTRVSRAGAESTGRDPRV